MKKERIDKVLATTGYGSRKEVHKLIKKGLVSVNNSIINTKDFKVEPKVDVIKVSGVEIEYKTHIYVMLNKPKGYVSSTDDPINDTVLMLLDDQLLKFKPFPAGRLDKGTEGLLLLTNDGELAHNILSPKKSVPKLYEATLYGSINDSIIDNLQNGVELEDGHKTKPAKINIIKQEPELVIEIEVIEGKYHQIKRMMASQGLHVLELKRVKLANLVLDKSLKPGQYRELTKEELELLKSL